MILSCFEFLTRAAQSPPLLVASLLTLGVLLVNGWTDAPNAIAGVVATGGLSFRKAVSLAAVFNFLGVLCVTAVNASVAQTIYSLARFSGGQRQTLLALCAAMTAIILWATLAWFFGIPTSESHALAAGISGAAVALEGSFACLNLNSWGKILLGLVLSTLFGAWAGGWSLSLVRRLDWPPALLRLCQVPAAAASAFFHGAQDGQKFLGLFLLAVALAGEGPQLGEGLAIPPWLMLACALAMAAGTALGGRRIIEKVAEEMVTLGPREGLASDLAGCGCLLVATLFGLPVSTTHTRTAALLGVGKASAAGVDRRVAGEIVLAWLFTFPACFLIGWQMARFFLRVF